MRKLPPSCQSFKWFRTGHRAVVTEFTKFESGALALCLAQFVLRYDALMRLDQAFDPIPTPTVFLWQHSSDLVYAGGGIACECGRPKADGLTDVELVGRHGGPSDLKANVS